MLNFFQNIRERKALAAAYRETAARTTWVVITCLEKNEEFFSTHDDWADRAREAVQGAMQMAEKGNYRMAFNFGMHFINKTLDTYPELLTEHSDLANATKAIISTSKEVLSPLFEKHHG